MAYHSVLCGILLTVALPLNIFGYPRSGAQPQPEEFMAPETPESAYNLLEHTSYHWTGFAWKETFKYTYSRDGQGRLVQRLTYAWNGLDWQSSSKLTFGYNDEGQLWWQLYQLRSDGGWRNVDSMTYAYDSLGNLIEEFHLYWRSETWENFEKRTWTYDSLGEWTIELVLSWDFMWVRTLRYIYHYDELGRQPSVNVQWWQGGWADVEQWLYSWGLDGQTTEYLRQRMIGESWQDDFRILYSYNVDGLLEEELHQLMIYPDWTDYRLAQYDYDAYGNRIELLRKTKSGESWENDLMSVYVYDTPTDVGEDTPANLPGELTIHQNYPNPFNPTTTVPFELPRRSDVVLTVYDLLGREVVRTTQTLPAGSHTIEVDMSDLASGVYLYRLRAGDISDSKKMLLLK